MIGLTGREGFLVTEAIRGEGATLHDAAGERFVDGFAPATRSPGAIALRLQETGQRSVGLDMRAIDPARFPNVVASLREAGLNPTRELIPVAPAAHYMMGGIVADLDARSSVPGLYAVGESSCTGLHGANRLASNSLSECFVFARRAVLHALSEPPPTFPSPLPREIGGAPSAPPLPSTDALAPTRRAVAGRRHRPLRRGAPAAVARRSPSAGPAARAQRARAQRESRGAHRRPGPPPSGDPALDHRHFVLAGDGSGSWQTWV